jgi:hypothetical protein
VLLQEFDKERRALIDDHTSALKGIVQRGEKSVDVAKKEGDEILADAFKTLKHIADEEFFLFAHLAEKLTDNARGAKKGGEKN